MIDKLTINLEQREKKAFYASDYGKSAIDLYFGFTGEPVTNPASWNETLKWGAGNGVEAQMLTILKDSNIVPSDYDQKIHGRIEIEPEPGIFVHGYIDALSIGGRPIEIKSINNKNSYDIKKYENNNPRESYVAQLATYMEAKEVDKGALFVSSIDGLNYFWFDCDKIGYRLYKCGNVVIDLDKEYKRWRDIYNNNIKTGQLPDPFEFLYKYDVNTIDWYKTPKATITKARTGKAVIGDWQVQWSPWKNRIVELQGTTLGYTNEELKIILEKTNGYTTW